MRFCVVCIQFIPLCESLYNSSFIGACLAGPSVPSATPPKSGISMMDTIKLVQPVKCCVRWPLPVAGSYCSQAKPVSFQDSKTVLTRLRLRLVYKFVACCACEPPERATS